MEDLSLPLRRTVVGNAATDDPHRGGWFIGHFMEENALQHSQDVEVKWGVHQKDDRNEKGFTVNKNATTVSILISGHFRLWFQDGDLQEQVDLNTPGKYALWRPGVAHNWQAIADCTILTVRWPSIPNDQAAPMK